jgi:hypothetical protein
MVDDCNDGGIEVGCEIANRCDCDAFEWPIEVPMLEAMGIACDDCRFVAVNVVSVIAVTAGMVIIGVVRVIVMVRFFGAIVMDVRIVPSAMPMMKDAQDINRVRSNRVSTMEANIFPPSVNAVSRSGQCRTGDRRYPVGRRGTAQTRSSEVLSL